MERVTSFAQHNRTLNYLTNTQTKLADLQNQISSGRKSLHYDGISRHTERLLTLESSHMRVTQYIEGNELVERRLRTQEANIAEIFDLMSEYKTLLVDALNGESRIVVSSRAIDQHTALDGWRMLIVQPLLVDGSDDGEPFVAVDDLGSGVGETVIITSDGKSVREAMGSNNTPVRWMVIAQPD